MYVVDSHNSRQFYPTTNTIHTCLPPARCARHPPPRLLHNATFDAIVATAGLLDVHPFRDGNGRLCRLLLNWILQRAGIPFPVNICATIEQRGKYSATIKGWVKHVQQMNATNTAAGQRARLVSGRAGREKGHSLIELQVYPFAQHVAEQLLRAWEEFSRMRLRLVKAATDSASEAAVRAAREQKRDEACMICMEDVPNIATLCCGAAVHLNCMGKWLAEAPDPTCVSCRTPLPRPVLRPADPALVPAAAGARAGARAGGPNVAAAGGSDPESAGTTTEASDDTETSRIDHHALPLLPTDVAVLWEQLRALEQIHARSNQERAAQDALQDDTTTTSESDDDTTTTTGEAGDTDDTAEDTTTATSTVHAGDPAHQQVSTRIECVLCRNIAASGCTNRMCGGCCRSNGRYSCDRHNG